MPMQAKAEGVKLFHAKAQLWALLGFVLVLLWFANHDSERCGVKSSFCV